jgi:hypothetical protein
MDSATYEATRSALHAVAESLLAGPQQRRSGTIRLAVTADGFSTLPIDDDVRRIRVVDTAIVVDTAHGERRTALHGTLGSIAGEVGLDLVAPRGVYTVVSDDGPSTPVTVDADALTTLVDSLARGDGALRRVGTLEAGESAPEPVLWPEHFDVSITIDEVNLGVSPGDGFLAEPYAYVGPLRPRAGAFWNQPFGAARRLSELPDVDAVAAWFELGLATARRDPPA